MNRRPCRLRLRAVLSLAAALAATIGAAAPARSGTLVVAVGKPAPAFLLDALDGAPLSGKRFGGKPLFINVFATWCGPCRLELPGIVRSYARFKNRVTYLGVDEQEPAGAIAPFARKMGIAYAIGIDQGQMEASYRAHQIPTSIFVDRSGIVRAFFQGPIPEHVLERDLALIAGPSA